MAGHGANFQGWLPLRRLYPVNASTQICVVCFIGHNSKGKAKCAIILMDSSVEAYCRTRISDLADIGEIGMAAAAVAVLLLFDRFII
jgi:N-acetylmuramoyl-L-alanine amidase